MCGVIGFYSKTPNPKHLEAVCRLFDQSQIRGRHAFGFSSYDRHTADQIRNFRSTQLVEVKKKIVEMRYTPPSYIIGHTRYSTSGDWQNPFNNQPIHIKGVSLAFNGVITQASKEQYEKIFNKKYETENDGEIFCRKVKDGEDWEGFVANGRFSFAGVFIHEGRVKVIRNRNRPLYYGFSLGGVFVASTRDIFTRAGGFENIREVPVGKPLFLDELI